MTDFTSLFNLLFPFFGVIGLGALFARTGKAPEAGLAWMQIFLVYLALPCLFFRLIAEKPIAELTNWPFVAMTTLATATAFALSLGAARLCRLSPPETVMAGVTGAYANVGYMGPPMVVSLLGTAASAPVALIFVFDTIFLFSVTPALMGLTGIRGRGAVATGLDILRKVVTHPFVMATIVGIVASSFRWRPPAALDTMIGWLSGAAAPCALFLLGVTVALRPTGRVRPDVALLVAIKLVVHPVAVWVLLSLVGGIDPIWIEAAVVMAALPSALNVFVLARQYETGIERASACILLGTLISIGTLSVFILAMESRAVPLSLFGR